MPSKDPVQRFEDILDNIHRISRFTVGMTLEQFLGDARTYDAVERCLERISEAARKLDDMAELYCPGIPWANIRGIGNFLRHEYDRIDASHIWYVVEQDLPGLEKSVTSALRRLTEPNR